MRANEFILESIYDMYKDWPEIKVKDGQIYLTYIRGHEDTNKVLHQDGRFKEINANGEAYLTRMQKNIDRDTVANTQENFADGKKPGRKGLAKRSGVNCKASVTSLRKTAKNSSGEKARMAHWCANMKSGKKK